MYRENRKAFYFLLFDNNFWFKGEIHILIESIGKKNHSAFINPLHEFPTARKMKLF